MTLNEDTRFRYLAETSRVLRNAGFDVEPQTDGSLSVGFEGNPLCNVVNPGGITYRSENLTTPQLEQAKDQAFEAVKLTAEYMKAYDQGQPLKAAGLVNGYRAIADYNGTVLAAAESHLGMQFVTWAWDFNRAGVSHGHYFGGNYEGAKQDFATRSQLIDHNRLFTPEQTIEIYRCCADALNYGLDLTYEQEKNIKSVQEQIETAMPDILEHIQQQDHQAQEPIAPELKM